MDTATRDYPPGDIRVSDADRDRALSELSEHFQAGRLDKDEFDERSGQVLQARTGKQLRALLADLPRSQQNPDPRPAPVPGPGQPRRPWILPLAPIVFVAIAVALLTGGHGHHGLGVITVPIVVALLIFLRLMRGGGRRGPRGWRY
jgi:Domain of unknown function (DUF1707)